MRVRLSRGTTWATRKFRRLAKTTEWNPSLGVWEDIEDDPQTGDLIIHTRQNVQPALDWANKQRNSGVNDLGGARDGADLKHYAILPAHVVIALREKGINIWDKACTKDMIKEIERNHPKCKVTNRKIL